MRLRDSYDIPEDVSRGPHSPAFAQFLWNWFGDTTLLLRGELDLTVLNDLTPEELAVAREMVSRNLKLRYTHIIEGVSALHPVFPDCLQHAKASGNRFLMSAHLLQVLWLDDARAIDFLIDLLPDIDRESLFWRIIRRLTFHPAFRWILFLVHTNAKDAGPYALSLLNRLESGDVKSEPPREMWHLPSDYRKRRNEPAFRESMTAAIHKWNVEMKKGR